MSLPRFRYAILCGVAFGVVVPVVVLFCFWLRVLHAGEWLLLIWPTSLMLMATEMLGHSLEAFRIVAVSIALNVILYICLFCLFWCLAWAIRAWRLSIRDGTTI